MILEGTTIHIKKSAKEMYEYFTDLSNFKHLMPKNIQKFQVDGNSLLFGLQGMPEIRLTLKEQQPYSKIILEGANSKFPFKLMINISEINKEESKVQLIFSGNFNPMMALMVKKPLTKLVDTLTENIEKI